MRKLYEFLRSNGIDARLDRVAAHEPQDWDEWTLGQLRSANFVLVIVSPSYQLRAEGRVPLDEGRGVQFEARQILREFYIDRRSARRRFLAVLLPGESEAHVPDWLGGPNATYYRVADYSVAGAESLIRYLTNQPREVASRLGAMPLLPPTPNDSPQHVVALARQLSTPARNREVASTQAYVRQLLTAGQIGLGEEDLHPSSIEQNRIEVALACTAITIHADLSTPAALHAAEHSLVGSLNPREGAVTPRSVVILTDGAHWLLYRINSQRQLRLVSRQLLEATNAGVGTLLDWLESILATAQRVRPTPRSIFAKLGADSPSYMLDYADLSEMYAAYSDVPSVAIKRHLWAKLLTTALGTNFTDEDSLFINHTLLVLMAEIIGHVVIGIPPESDDISGAALLSGKEFLRSEVYGVIERDFFDWILEVPRGEVFVKALAARLARFSWIDVEHDLMKVLYESIIGSETRHRLGEYYTPDWLAEEVLLESIGAPLAQRVLDASCGSGTFIFHAVRAYLLASEEEGWTVGEAIQGVVRNVVGIDVHPVAVTLARVTYLLAIGLERIQHSLRPSFAVPVYLSDSLHWGDESTLLSYQGLSVSTAEGHEIFDDSLEDEAEHLRFPDRVVDDASRFDQLVSELAERATARERNSTPPSIDAILARHEVDAGDWATLKTTFERLCALHDQNRDHIWSYYVRNLARPLWLSRPGNRVDVLIGNPPWLAYRYMTSAQQASFRRMASERGMWAGARLAPTQDLSALFVARCVEQYLKIGGTFAFVMPLATLSRQQYAGFRAGIYPVPAELVCAGFSGSWDLHKIKPPFFPVPACVVFGSRLALPEQVIALSNRPEVWEGRFATTTASRSQATSRITRTSSDEREAIPGGGSPYGRLFVQGATIVPHVLLVVEPDEPPRLGTGANRQAVRSKRSSQEKKPWKDCEPLRGVIENKFVRPFYNGSSVLPFRCLRPAAYSVVPWDGNRLLHGEDTQLDSYHGLADWWRSAEGVWTRNRSTNRLDLVGRLDFQRGLSRQFPIPELRVVYSANGMYLAAAVLADSQAIVEHNLYWAAARSMAEARYLTAVLNSAAVMSAIVHLQSRGQHNPRHIDKYVWRLPIPAFSENDPMHRALVDLATVAEEVAENVSLPTLRFESQRKRVREALRHQGVEHEIDLAVNAILV